MKKALIFVLVIVIALFALLGVSYFIFETQLKSQILPEIKKIIKDTTDLDVDFTEFHFSFSKLIQLEPSIRIRDLKIQDGLAAEKIYAELYIKPLFKKRFEVKELDIENLNLKLVENAKKEVFIKGINPNKIIEKLEEKKHKNKKDDNKKDDSPITEIALKKVRIKNSQLEYLAYGQSQALRLTNVNIDLNDFGYSENGIVSKVEMSSGLFNSGRSRLYIKGDLGPFPETLTSLPIKASQSLKINLQDLPEKTIQETFSGMVKSSSGSEIEETAWLSGDVFGTLYGEGKVKLKNFELGATDKHTLTANSELPLKFSLRLNASPSLYLETNNASLDLKDKDSNKGRLVTNSKFNLDINSGALQGSSSGTISGLELEEALATFLNVENVISGNFELKNYQVSFSGANADELGRSMTGTGSISIKDGSLYILKSITKYKDVAKMVLTNGDALTEKLAGNFLLFTSDLVLEKRNLSMNNINLAAPDGIGVTGKGTVKKGEFLVFDVDLKLPKLTAIPINIRGTVEKPSVYPDLKNMSAKQTEQVVNQGLQYGLDVLNQVIKGATKQAPSTNGAIVETSTPSPNLSKPSKKDLEKAGKDILFGVLNSLKEAPTTTPAPVPTSPPAADTSTVNGASANP